MEAVGAISIKKFAVVVHVFVVVGPVVIAVDAVATVVVIAAVGVDVRRCSSSSMCSLFAVAIERIIDNWKSEPIQMHSQLMCAASNRNTCHT